jgi:succinoglycan biosynthesis protein ExoM
VHEERPGIAAARNKALEVSYLERFLIFIDDDERPTDGWLDRLMACYFDSHPAAVVGPVISKFNAEPDQWVQAGDFFRRRRMPTGTSIKVAATNNLLLDLTQVRAWNLRFDEKFGISGGSDTLFSRSIVANGGVMVWCDEAVVIDQVPAARITRRWVLLRAFRSGNSWSRVSLHMERTVLGRLALRCRLTGAGLLRVAAGGSRAAWGVLVRSQVHEAKGLRTLSRGTGMVSGAYGYVYEEYRRNS